MKLIHMTFSEMNTRARASVTANADACAGCRVCETVCSLAKTGRIQPSLARIKVAREPFAGRFSPAVCHHCSQPDCLKACPEAAIGVSPRTGAVLIDSKKCIGCGTCATACPYGMIAYDPEMNKSVKCDLCNGSPKCVDFCPANALGLTMFGQRRSQ